MFTELTIYHIIGFLGYFLIKFLVQTGFMMFRQYKMKDNL